MALLNQRNVFYVNPLERQVRDAFRPYLLSRMTPAPPGRTIPFPLDAVKRKEPAKEAKQPVFRRKGVKRLAGALRLLLALALLFLLGKRG